MFYMQGIEKVSNMGALYEAFQKSKQGSDWKESVQRYEYDIWPNLYRTREELNSGTYQQKPFVEFTISERGKTRHIKSIHISDRVVQRSLCDNVLTPATEKYLIYDNGASQEGKGVDFTRKRLKEHLRRYFAKYHTNRGYVVLIDFRNYFGSIDHQLLLDEYRKVIPEDDLMELISYLVNINPGDCGLGIGAQLSQNAGIFYPTPIDQYFKTVRGLKFYGAYMDDRYAILQTKKEALEVLQEFRQRADALKLTINEKKTQIVRLEKGFTFLKMRYVLTETGKIVEYQSADTFTRERRRIKAFKRIGMEPERAAECYRSWRGTVLRIPNNYFRVKRMDQLFAELFPGADFRTQKEKRKEHDENLQHSRQGTEEAGRVAERRRTSTPW